MPLQVAGQLRKMLHFWGERKVYDRDTLQQLEAAVQSRDRDAQLQPPKVSSPCSSGNRLALRASLDAEVCQGCPAASGDCSAECEPWCTDAACLCCSVLQGLRCTLSFTQVARLPESCPCWGTCTVAKPQVLSRGLASLCVASSTIKTGHTKVQARARI